MRKVNTEPVYRTHLKLPGQTDAPIGWTACGVYNEGNLPSTKVSAEVTCKSCMRTASYKVRSRMVAVKDSKTWKAYRNRRVPLVLSAEANCEKCQGSGWWEGREDIRIENNPGACGGGTFPGVRFRNEMCPCVRTARK